ncbi:MAG TPA: hypothetical protein VLK66_02275 [Longimicrobium sp.]|nr:hypothetical protein [Longimicrobium sp.]
MAPHQLPAPQDAAFVGTLRVTTADGAPVVLDSAWVRGDTLAGIAREVPRRHMAIALSDVRLVERRGEASTTAIVLVVAAVVAVASYVRALYVAD